MKKFKKFFTFVFSTVLATSSVLSTSSMAVTPADVEAKDPNGDGVITMADVAFMYQILSGKYNPSDLTRFDIDDNGVVSDVDAIYTHMYTVGMLSNSVSPTPDEETSSIMAAETSSTSRNYRVYNAQTGAYNRSYSLTIEEMDTSNSPRYVIAPDDRVEDWSNTGVVEIKMHDTELSYSGTGFVVGKHIIATAAHNLFDNETRESFILDSIFLYDEDENKETLTPVEYHIPLNYIFDSGVTNYDFDYALIAIEEDLSEYMTFNLGVITDYANNLPINVIGFPGTAGVKMKSSGTITNTTNWEYVFEHDADTSAGQSGSPIFAIETVNGTTYNTVVGIHVAGFNKGMRFTPHNLKFYNGNTNIQY